LEIVERARSGAPAGHTLANHLAECSRCAERWEAEMELSRGLRDAQSSVMRLRSTPDARARLMAEFDERQHHVVMHRWLVWAMAAFGILLLAGALQQLRRAGRGTAPHTAQTEADHNADELMAENGFVPVPYAAPLAPGEFVEVVQRELTPAALARMGFVIQSSYNSDVTAELMVGQDGLPRAVRVPESVDIRY
jgi:predicted anti-sigma-YlaC factor YlaD